MSEKIDRPPSEPCTFGPERRKYLSGALGFYMRFNRDVRKCVVFLGYPVYEGGSQSSGLTVQGTGFLLSYEGLSYLVTARHVAVLLQETCAARINMKNGTSSNIIGEDLPWSFHPDSAVDLAVVPFGLDPKRGFDALILPHELILTEDQKKADFIELGDICYTVGLFRVLTGYQRNLPVIHTGHLARMSGEERIAIKDPTSADGKQLVDGYLVETQSLSGLSGSPVFIRRSLRFAMRGRKMLSPPDKIEARNFPEELKDGDDFEVVDMVAYSNEVSLLGVFQAAWEAPAGEVIAFDRGKEMTVPIGMGVVVPASKIVEILEMPKHKQEREEFKKKSAMANAATPQSIHADVAKTSVAADENPTHREDFDHLLKKAAKVTKDQ